MIARTLDEQLRAAARRDPAGQAVVAEGQELSFASLDNSADGAASALAALGVERGDRVAVMLPNGLDAVTAIYGVIRSGGALTPLNPDLKREKLHAILADSQPRVLLCDAEREETARAAAGDGPTEVRLLDSLSPQGAPPPPPVSVDLGCVVYTSGSTGEPKGVMHSHANMAFVAGAITDSLGLDASDRTLSVLQLSFGYGLYQLFTSVLAGGTLVLEPGIGLAGRLVKLLDEERITVLPGVPTVFGVLLSLPGIEDRQLGDLRLLTNAGAPLPEATGRRLRAAFPGAELCTMYGQTEAQRICCMPPGGYDERPASSGLPVPGTEAWIEDEGGERLPAGEVGELVVRGAHVMHGYWGGSDRGGERLRPGRWPWERVLATGDLFRIDEAGYLYFESRSDDVFKSRGEKVVPREVEEVLHAAPGVREAAVVGVPDELLGNAVHAHVAPEAGEQLEAAALKRYCAERLEGHLIPKKVVVHTELPRNASGKIDKRALAAPEA